MSGTTDAMYATVDVTIATSDAMLVSCDVTTETFDVIVTTDAADWFGGKCTT